MRTSYGLRAFGLYFIILGTLVWFTLDYAVERLNDSMRQSAESVMVDMSNLIAAVIEKEIADQQPTQSSELPLKPLAALFDDLSQRKLQARIYNVTKTEVDSSVVVTDAKGMVLYDSTGNHTGKDFSRWNDIKLTLQGEYGARTSYIDQNRTEPEDPKAMYIAAPITVQGEIVGAVSVAKPIDSLETHLVAESKQLQQYAFLLLLLALVIGYLLSLWFTYALNKISTYANAMAAGENAEQPTFFDSRLTELSNAVTNLRTQVDGKSYVEEYIHSLTHELKTPLTSIGATVELMQEPMSEEDQARFLTNLANSNQRMAKLVDRMLSLAQLEGLNELVNSEQFDLQPGLKRLIAERQTVAEQKEVSISLPSLDAYLCHGDKVLLSQAIANLIDNALRFCSNGSKINITLTNEGANYQVAIENRGPQIPDYALNKIYDRFFSLPNSDGQASQTKSTGLGLSFVKEIMKLHHGQVSVRNIADGVIATLSWPSPKH